MIISLKLLFKTLLAFNLIEIHTDVQGDMFCNKNFAGHLSFLQVRLINSLKTFVYNLFEMPIHVLKRKLLQVDMFDNKNSAGRSTYLCYKVIHFFKTFVYTVYLYVYGLHLF